MNKKTSSPYRLRIKSAVISALSHCNNLQFPVNIKQITKSYSNVRLITYSSHMKKYNLSYEEMMDEAETGDAFTVYNSSTDQYLIFYNNIDQNLIASNRYRWNIAHELGHVVLKHHKRYRETKIFRNSLSKKEYLNLENEADIFAAYILVPHSVIYYYHPENYHALKRLCVISEKAAKIRFNEYSLWLSRGYWGGYDYNISKLFLNTAFYKHCTSCLYTYKFVSSEFERLVFYMWKEINITYCPICGNNKFEPGDENMIYHKLETHDNGKLKICPICNNEETECEGEYCQICGTPLVNKCSTNDNELPFNDNCVQILPSNARYCPLCRSKSKFLKIGILKEWNYHEPEPSIFSQIPDGAEEKLPFY